MKEVILLAGGISKRFYPLKDKVMYKFLGKPLIEWQIDWLLDAGFTHIVVVVNPRIYKAVNEIIGKKDANIKIVIQENALGMGDAVLKASECIKGGNSVFIVGASDVVEKGIYQEFKRSNENLILAYKVSRYFPGGYLVMQDGRIVDIIEKPGEGNEPSNIVNIVRHLHTNFGKLLTYIEEEYKKPERTDDEYENALRKLMKEEYYKPLIYNGIWLPVKYPWHILDLTSYFLTIKGNYIAEDVKIGKNVIIENSYIEEGVKIYDNVVIRNSYIAKNCVIGNNTLIRDSIINENSIIGAHSEVARSYINNNVEVHRSYVGDSVIDSFVRIGAGTIIANLRHDEQEIQVFVRGKKVNSGRKKLGAIIGEGSKIGINNSILPGRIIGRNVTTYPGSVIIHNPKDGEIVKGFF